MLIVSNQLYAQLKEVCRAYENMNVARHQEKCQHYNMFKSQQNILWNHIKKVHLGSEIFCYDFANRKLHYIIASEKSA